MIPILYLDNRGNPRDLSEVKEQVKGLGIERYVPLEVRSNQFKDSKTSIIPISAEDFEAQIKSLECPLYKHIRSIMGDNTQVCMNLTAMLTNYLAELHGFPVVGLFRREDEDMKFYLRPTVALFDRRVCFPEYAEHEPCGVEDFIEAKIGSRKYLIDFNFFYSEEPTKSRVLIEEVEDWSSFANKYGLYPTQYDGFSEDSIGDLTIKEYLDEKVSGPFAWMVGDPHQKSWHGLSNLSVRDYIKTLSSGALISQGYSPSDLSGSGRIWFPCNFEDRRLLLKLPQPE